MDEVTCMPTTFFTATHVLTADAAVLPPVFSGTALAPACVVMERCRPWCHLEAQKQRGKKARQGKGKGKKRLPAAKSAMAKIHKSTIFFLNARHAKPAVQYNASRYRATSLGVDCHR
jgi:hypothetical protein